MLDEDKLREELDNDMMQWHVSLPKPSASVERPAVSTSITQFTKTVQQHKPDKPHEVNSGANTNFQTNAIAP